MTAGEGLIHLLRLGRASVAHFLRPSHAPSDDPALPGQTGAFRSWDHFGRLSIPVFLVQCTKQYGTQSRCKMSKFPVTADEEDCFGVMWGRGFEKMNDNTRPACKWSL